MQSLWLGLPWRDTQGGFKLFTQRAVDLLFPCQQLDGVVYDGEVLYLARQAELRVVEVPVVWQHDPDSRIRYGVSASLAVFRDLWRIRRVHRGRAENPRGMSRWLFRGAAVVRVGQRCEGWES